MMIIKAYTDGSCNHKNRFGGLGVYAAYRDGASPEAYFELSEGFVDTTISRMELMAVMRTLQMVKPDFIRKVRLTIYSDSQYVVNSINKEWARKWIKEGIERYDGTGDNPSAIENKRILFRLWRELLILWDLFPKRNIKICWVKGHSGVDGNEKADTLARNAYHEELNKSKI